MRNHATVVVLGICAILFALTLVCTTPQNPTEDTRNFRIAVADLGAVGDTAYFAGDSLRVSVSIDLPNLLDSLVIVTSDGGLDTVFRPSGRYGDSVELVLGPIAATDTVDVELLAVLTDGAERACSLSVFFHGYPPRVDMLSAQVVESEQGNPCTLAVSLSAGTPPVSYRWQHNGSELENATADTLILPAVVDSSTGMYRCVVTNRWGSDTTDTVEVSFHRDTLPPVAKGDSFTVAEDSALMVGAQAGVLANDQRLGSDSLWAILTESAGHGVLSLDSNGGFTYSPNANYFGSDSFFYRAINPVGDSEAIVHIVVSPVSDPPRVTVNAELAVVRGDTAVLGDSILAATDPDDQGSSLAFEVLHAPLNGELQLRDSAVSTGQTFTQSDIDSALVRYVHSGGADQGDTALLRLSDQAGATVDSIVLPVAITPEPSALQLAANTGLEIGEGDSMTIGPDMLRAVSHSADTITFTLTSYLSYGVLKRDGTVLTSDETFTQGDIDSSKLEYLHDGSSVPSDQFSFVISDDQNGQLEEAVFAITISPVNDTPVVIARSNLVISRGDSARITGALLRVEDEDDGASDLTYTVTKQPAHGVLGVGASQLAAAGTFTQSDVDSSRLWYRHDSSATLCDTIALKVADPHGAGPGPITVAVSIGATNAAPVAEDQALNVAEDDSVVVTLSAYDPDSSIIAEWETVSQPVHGTLSGTAPSLVYRPDPDFFGADSFSFRAGDGVLWGTPAMVRMAITAVNDAPVVSDIPNASAIKGTGFSVALNDYVSDVDNDLSSLSWTIEGATNLDAVIDSTSHEAAIRPVDSLWTGADTLVFTVSDPGGLSDADDATFTLTPGLSAPAVSVSTPTNDSTPTWSWISAGGTGQYRYRLDNPDLSSSATATAATSFSPSNGLTEGTHTLYVQEKDVEGNWSDVGKGRAVLDYTAPVAPAVSVAPTVSNDGLPEWSWSSAGDGAGTYRWKLDNSNLDDGATVTAELSYRPPSRLVEGNHTLYVQEQDSAGNWSESGSALAEVTYLSPDITLSEPSLTNDSGVVESATPTVSGTTNSAVGVASVTVLVNGSSVAVDGQESWSCTPTLNAKAWNLVLVSVVDSMSRSTSAEYHIYRKPTQPSPPSVSFSDVTDSTISVDWLCASDCGSFCDSFEVRRGESQFGPFDVAASGLTGSSYLDTSVKPCGSYFYVVKGYYVAPGSMGIEDSVVTTAQNSNSGGYFQRVLNWSSSMENAYCVRQTSDDGYIVAGSTDKNGDRDILLIKLSSAGDSSWTLVVRETGDQEANSVIETSGGDLIITGYDKPAAGSSELRLMAFSADGSILKWQKNYRANGAASGQGLATVGSDIIVSGTGDQAIYVLRCDAATGDTLWTMTRALVDGSFYSAPAVVEMNDFEIAIGGHETHLDGTPYNMEFFIMEVNPSNGSLLRTDTFGSSDVEAIGGMVDNYSNGYLVAGESGGRGYLHDRQYDGTTIDSVSLSDATRASWVEKTGSSGYVICGEDTGGDVWVAKVASDLSVAASSAFDVAYKARFIQQSSDGAFILVCQKYESDWVSEDIVIIKTDENLKSPALAKEFD